MNPNIIPISTTNPLASRWQRDSSNPEETPQGYKDVFFQYAMNFTVSANQFAQNLSIILDGDADFVLRQIEPTIFEAGSPTVLVGAFRFKDCYGNPLDDDLLTSTDFYGPIFTELVLQKGKRFFMDVDNTQQGFNVQVAVMLRGCKRFQKNGQ
jgi:hypothetical protein